MLENVTVPGIHEGIVAIRKMSDDEKTRALAQYREDRLREERSALGFATRKGLAKGLEEGRKEGKKEAVREVVFNMFKNGMNDDIIKLATGISDDLLSQYRNEYNRTLN